MSKTGSLKKPLTKNIEDELLDLAYELGGIDSTLMTNACYIGKKMFGIDLPDDFKNYGKLFLASDFLDMHIHSLERLTHGIVTEMPPADYDGKDSTLGKLGSLLKNYTKEEIRIASVYLLRGYIPNNFSEKEIGIAEPIIEDIRKKGQSYFATV